MLLVPIAMTPQPLSAVTRGCSYLFPCWPVRAAALCLLLSGHVRPTVPWLGS